MGKTKIEEYCYMCEAKATSREHVPPQCLFPEAKDIGEDLFRSNLITVPSCDIHNSAKSMDDEFLMICLSSFIENNTVGFIHFNTKVFRAIRRKTDPNSFLSNLFQNPRKVSQRGKDGQEYTYSKADPDLARLVKCFEHIARGLYRAEFGQRFKGDCDVWPHFLEFYANYNNKLSYIIEKAFENESKGIEDKGANPKVFTYRFAPPAYAGMFMLKMTFYGGTDVYVRFLAEGTAPPQNITLELIKMGIPTIVNIGPNEHIEFN